MFQAFFLALIKLYKIVLSPLLGNNCRHLPTCSDYMKEAILKHGTVKGMYLGTRRLLRCHPFSKRDMHDPVP